MTETDRGAEEAAVLAAADSLITAFGHHDVERYFAAFPALDRTDFMRSAAILAAQRNCKILGIFTRLWKRDGKPRYLGHLPRVWRLLEQDLAHPVLAPIAGWLDRHLPPPARQISA